MNATETSTGRLAKSVSTAMFFAGVLVLGLGGFLLLCGVAYGMVTDNLALGVACALVLFIPYLLGVVWLLTSGFSLMAERVPQKAKEAAEALSES